MIAEAISAAVGGAGGMGLMFTFLKGRIDANEKKLDAVMTRVECMRTHSELNGQLNKIWESLEGRDGVVSTLARIDERLKAKEKE
jgi:hypothetical protein